MNFLIDTKNFEVNYFCEALIFGTEEFAQLSVSQIVEINTFKLQTSIKYLVDSINNNKCNQKSIAKCICFFFFCYSFQMDYSLKTNYERRKLEFIQNVFIKILKY